MRRILAIMILMLMQVHCILAQGNRSIKNLPNYDSKIIHFGFSLGVNNLGVNIKMVDDFMGKSDIYGVDLAKHMGFHVGPLADLRICKYLDLRAQFLLSFNQRDLSFHYRDFKSEAPVLNERVMNINSTMLEFPLLLKAKGERLNNVAPYVVAGGAFRYDLSAGKNPEDEEAIQLKKIDPCLQAGMGFDFYLPYFKLSLELKYSLGMMEVFDPNGTSYSNSIKSIKSNGLMLSIHFE